MTEEFSPRKRSLVAIAAAVAFLLLIGLLLGTSTWIFSSALVSIPSPEPDYVVVARPFSQLFIACLVSVIVLVTAHAAVAKFVWRIGRWPDAMTWRHVAPYCPLLLLAFPLVALGMLATPLAWLAPPWLYFLVDLRWWLWLGIIGLLVKSVADATPVAGSVRRTSVRPIPALVWDLTLIIVLLAGALAVSPTERYSSDVVGDEPKYLRYLENWYRGAGTDITNLVPINDLPTDFKPDISGNFGHAARGLATIATDLADDVRRLAGRAAPEPPGPARSDGGLFVDGKRGGVYQVHSPGLPALLFPGYVIDRTLLLRPTASPRSQFSPRLFVTSTLLLAIYLLWGWGLFRLLTAYTSNVSLSWVLTCVAMLSLPATAFSYQYYPEAAGGLFLVLVVRYVLCSTETRIWPAFAYGLLAGYLPWIHLRFGVAALVAAIAVTVTRSKHSRRSIVGFWTGLACPLALFEPVHVPHHRQPAPVEIDDARPRSAAFQLIERGASAGRALLRYRLGPGCTCARVPYGARWSRADVASQPPRRDPDTPVHPLTCRASRGAQLDWQWDHTSPARRGRRRAPDRAAVGRARPLSPIPVVHWVVRRAVDRVGSERVRVQRALRQDHRPIDRPDFQRVDQPHGPPQR